MVKNLKVDVVCCKVDPFLLGVNRSISVNGTSTLLDNTKADLGGTSDSKP